MHYEIVEYLTEEKLKYFIVDVIQPDFISCQYKVKLDNRNVKIDAFFIKNNINFFVEFNVHYHYTSTKNIIRDIEIREYCSINNIVLVEFPYFVQLTNKTYKIAFEKVYDSNVDIECNFSHGFMDKACTLPYDFTDIGYKRYLSDLNRFDLHDEIEKTYINIKSNLVIPW